MPHPHTGKFPSYRVAQDGNKRDSANNWQSFVIREIAAEYPNNVNDLPYT